MATYLNGFIRHCRVVRMANLAQLVNAIAPIFTSPQGLFLQTIYHPLRLYAEHMREVALDVHVDGPRHDLPPDLEERTFGRVHHVADLGPFPLLDAVATCDEAGRELTIGVVNRDRDQRHAATIDLGGATADRRAPGLRGQRPRRGRHELVRAPGPGRRARAPAGGHGAPLRLRVPGALGVGAAGAARALTAAAMPVPKFPLRAVAALFLERQHLARPRARRLTPRAARPVRRGRGGAPARLDQRARPRALPHALEPVRALRAGAARPPRLPAAAALRVLGARGLPGAGVASRRCGAGRCWTTGSATPAGPPGSGGTAGRSTSSRTPSATNGPAGTADFEHRRPGGRARLVELEARPARAPLPLDDRGARRALAPALPEAVRPRRARPAGLAGRRAGLSTDGFRAWHVERSLHAMGGGDRHGPHALPHLPAHGAGHPPRGPPAPRRGGRGRGDRGPGLPRPLARPGAATFRRSGAPPGDAPDRAARPCSPRSTRSSGTASASERLFGFNYRIEVYTPGPKRVHGYYTLPILHDGQLIGRVDAKAHRAERRLAVRGVHFERWFATGGRTARRDVGRHRAGRGAGGRRGRALVAGPLHRRRPGRPRPRGAGAAAAAARPGARGVTARGGPSAGSPSPISLPSPAESAGARARRRRPRGDRPAPSSATSASTP